jgi:glucosamine--fructose-6-phosphate aminotransferase (isomerizing)
MCGSIADAGADERRTTAASSADGIAHTRPSAHGPPTDASAHHRKEARTSGAEMIGVGPADVPGAADSDAYLRIPDTHPVCQNLPANVQFVSYHTARELDRTIDKPRNPDESVTVQ